MSKTLTWNKNDKAKAIPVLLAEPNPKYPEQWRAWCPHCRRYHFHGAGEGHRTAHCTSEPPGFPDGYYLVEAGQQATNRVKPRPHSLDNNSICGRPNAVILG